MGKAIDFILVETKKKEKHFKEFVSETSDGNQNEHNEDDTDWYPFFQNINRITKNKTFVTITKI